MKKGIVKIDRERCKGCLLCVRACPFGVLEADSSLNSAGAHPVIAGNPDKCTACASCFQVCPDCAIEVFEIEGGTR